MYLNLFFENRQIQIDHDSQLNHLYRKLINKFAELYEIRTVGFILPNDETKVCETELCEGDHIFITSKYSDDQLNDHLEWFDKVSSNGRLLCLVEHQTEEICIAAIEQNTLALEFVNDKTEKICKVALKINPYLLRTIKDQTEEMCLVAMEGNIFMMEYVKNQTPRIIEKAMEKLPFAFVYIKHKTEDLCLRTVKKYPELIRYIKNPSDEVCRIAAGDLSNEKVLDHIKKYNTKAWLEITSINVDKEDNERKTLIDSIAKNPSAIETIENPDEELCLIAIKHDPSSIRFIKNPTLKTCIEALKDDTHNFKYIKQTEEICLGIIAKYPKVLKYINRVTDEIALKVIEHHPHTLNRFKNRSKDFYQKVFLQGFKTNEHISMKGIPLTLYFNDYDQNIIQYISKETRRIYEYIIYKRDTSVKSIEEILI